MGTRHGVQHPLLRPPVLMEEPTHLPAAGMQPSPHRRGGGMEAGGSLLPLSPHP